MTSRFIFSSRKYEMYQDEFGFLVSGHILFRRQLVDGQCFIFGDGISEANCISLGGRYYYLMDKRSREIFMMEGNDSRSRSL